MHTTLCGKITHALTGGIACAVLVLLACPSGEGAASPTGTAVAGLESYDRVIPALMRRWRIPGGAIAVARNGRIVLARGYGTTARRGGRPVTPEMRFRIASVSKPVTAAAVLQLVERGELALDDPVWPYLVHLAPPGPQEVDPRWKQVTVRQLLQHRGGWDRDATFDPMFAYDRVARALGVARPPGRSDVIRFMLTRGFESDPGTVYCYSNFGYAVLGEVIERVTGRPYEEHVREALLAPMGLAGMRIGGTREEELGDDEPRYEDRPGAPLVRSIHPDGPSWLPAPMGGFAVRTLDAHGGWVASAAELVRFALHLDGRPDPPDVLSAGTLAAMRARPDAEDVHDAAWYYGLGWMVRPVKASANWWHMGSLPGTTALLVGTHHGFVWAALFNSRPRRFGDFDLAVDRAMWEALEQVKEWPGSVAPQGTGGDRPQPDPGTT